MVKHMNRDNNNTYLPHNGAMRVKEVIMCKTGRIASDTW